MKIMKISALLCSWAIQNAHITCQMIIQQCVLHYCFFITTSESLRSLQLSERMESDEMVIVSSSASDSEEEETVLSQEPGTSKQQDRGQKQPKTLLKFAKKLPSGIIVKTIFLS